MNTIVKSWISAFRLRTLPLAFSSIITGSAIAYTHHCFNGVIFTLALLTTLFLQILSNLANDYGDSEHGTDNQDRIGPTRAVQSGVITKGQMKKAMVLFTFFSLASGIPLIVEGTKNINLTWFFVFLGLGISSIAAAIKYTAGRNPYGYKGLGDVFVFLFFGLVGVIGSFLLHYQKLNSEVFIQLVFPAISIGCFSAAVLNLNNMRDHENDLKSGKITLAVKLGQSGSKAYHFTLINTGILCMYCFAFFNEFSTINYLILSLPLFSFIIHLLKIYGIKEEKKYDPELKKVALTTFALSLVLLVILINN